MSDYGINIGSRRSRNVITPTFSRDFIANNTLNHGVGPNITFTRASSATFFTSTGILSTVPNNVPRFDYGNFRTNYIWNSTFTGAVAGNPGTPPSNGWVFQDSNRGISYIIKSVGIDSELGLPFMEIQLSGANTIPGGTGINASLAIYPLDDTQLQVLSGQTWTTSVYFKTIAGSLSGNLAVLYNFEVGSPMGQSITSFAPTTNWQRISNTRTMSITSEPRFLRPAIAIASIAPSNTIDYTFRIAAPQTELSSVATAFIPTTNAPATTGVPLGLLIEDTCANLHQRSAEFDNAYWTTTNTTVTANNALAPDGTNSADAIFETTANGFHVIVRGGVFTVGSVYTLSVFAKANGRTKFSLQVGGQQTANFDLVAVTATPVAIDGSPSASIQSVGNGWFRCTATRQSTVNSNSTILLLDNNGNTQYTGNASLGMYFWGVQAELGSFPTSYIPTTTLSATRQADVAQITPVTSFVNQSQGTLFSEFRTGPGFPVAAAFILDADSIGDRVGIFASGVTQIAINNVFTSIAGFSPFTNTIFKATLGYKAFNHASSINGQTVQGNTAIGVPINLSYLRIGCEGGSGFTGGQLSGHVRKVTYWPTKLSNNRLRLITS